MGPFCLPFNGGDGGLNAPLQNPLPDLSDAHARQQALAGSKPLFRAQAGGIQADTVLYVSVVFDIPIGGGAVTLIVPTTNGMLRFEDPFQRDGSTRVIAVPLNQAGLWLYHIDPFMKGHIVIGTSL